MRTSVALRTGIAVALAAATLLSPAPASAGDPVAGRKKAGMCRTCHGLNGVAQIPIAPHIAGESEIYLATQLKAFRSGKRVHEIMSVVAKGLSDEDIADLSAWYSSIAFQVTMPE